MQVWVGEDAFTLQQLMDESHRLADHLKPVSDFLKFWFSDKENFLAHTSGSTGSPKDIWLSRDQIMASARSSLSFFQLQPATDGLVLCLSASHVGGFMVLARALTGNMSLWLLKPDRQPFPLFSPVLRQKKWFVSMVPMQLHRFVLSPELLQATAHWKGILLGGAALNLEQYELIKKLKCPVFHSYGMTETASHVAIRQIHPEIVPQSGFKALPGVELKMGSLHNLCVKGAMTQHKWVETTDALAWLKQDEFELAGRTDEAINTGGLKVLPDALKAALKENPFFAGVNMEIVGLPDPELGQRVVLVIENLLEEPDWQTLWNSFSSKLDKKTLPKAVFSLKSFPLTPSLKTDKPALKTLLTHLKPTWTK